eukprot:COSAG01_NODE_1232_length_11111_cov_24.710770_9_plen_335_part_00
MPVRTVSQRYWEIRLLVNSAHGWACSARQSSEDCIYIMKVLRIKKKRESPPNREEPATRTVRRRRPRAVRLPTDPSVVTLARRAHAGTAVPLTPATMAKYDPAMLKLIVSLRKDGYLSDNGFTAMRARVAADPTLGKVFDSLGELLPVRDRVRTQMRRYAGAVAYTDPALTSACRRHLVLSGDVESFQVQLSGVSSHKATGLQVLFDRGPGGLLNMMLSKSSVFTTQNAWCDYFVQKNAILRRPSKMVYIQGISKNCTSLRSLLDQLTGAGASDIDVEATYGQCFGTGAGCRHFVGHRSGGSVCCAAVGESSSSWPAAGAAGRASAPGELERQL